MPLVEQDQVQSDSESLEPATKHDAESSLPLIQV